MSTTPTTQLLSLAGKSAVITGAASGIGLAMAERFADAGAHVHILDRTLPASDRYRTWARLSGQDGFTPAGQDGFTSG